MIVVDASVLSVALLDDTAVGELYRQRLRKAEMIAPALLDVEVTSVVRGRVRGGHVSDQRAALALSDLMALGFERVPHRGLIRRMWELRDNLSAYDAAYVALAELVGVPLVTADQKLSRAPGPCCEVETLPHHV